MSLPVFNPSEYYIMYYRHGVNALLSKNFHCPGDLRQAVERAQKHCGIMGYKYHFVRPLIADISDEEERQLNPRVNQRPPLPELQPSDILTGKAG